MQAGNFCHRAPVGYLNASVPGNIHPDPDRAEFVKTAFSMFDAGYAKAEILPRLNASGFNMPGTGKPVRPQTLDMVLRNPLYAGLIVSEAWEIRVRGQFQPLVKGDVFSRVQARLSGGEAKEREIRSRHSPEFPLRVFVRCSNCNASINRQLLHRSKR
jgi:hypothetical protein